MWEIFRPIATRIIHLAKTFVEKARAGGHGVNKIIVTGGFANSECLRQLFRDMVTKLNTKWTLPITIVFADKGTSSTAVAVGSNMRSSDKSHGPSHAAVQSIGILRHLQWGTEYFRTLPLEVRCQEA